MKFKISPVLLMSTLILFTVFQLKSQIAINEYDQIDVVKKGTTYIVMPDPGSEIAKPYVDIYKNYWTFSKIEFIKSEDIDKYISPENSFITLAALENHYTSPGMRTTTTFSNGKSMTQYSSGLSYTNTHIYLELWTCNEKYFKKKNKKKFDTWDRVQVGRIELFTDFESLEHPDILAKSDYDGGGHIRNWGPGFLKNYLQRLTALLNDGKETKLNKELINYNKLQPLRKQTLFVPDYVMIKFGKWTGNESKRHTEKDIFEFYKLKYSIIPTSELSDKILNEKEAFYYLLYIKSSTDKYINVVNSLTGDVIYSSYDIGSYNISYRDLKFIYRNTMEKL